MHHQNRNPNTPSLEFLRQQREGRPFCTKCQQFVKHKDAVWIARRQCRCPVCGELLERRLPTENSQVTPERETAEGDTPAQSKQGA